MIGKVLYFIWYFPRLLTLKAAQLMDTVGNKVCVYSITIR
jgi:hypothetical protein